jgi:hypothetical protein
MEGRGPAVPGPSPFFVDASTSGLALKQIED